MAVTSLVAAEDGDTRKAARLGAWWGLGHAGVLLVVGLPLIFLKSELPAWLESGAEKAVGVVILLLAARVMFKWARGDYRASAHAHPDSHGRRRHLRRGGRAPRTCRCAAPRRRSRSGCCTGSPAPARSCCC